MSTVEDFVQQEVVSPFLPGTKIQYAWDSTSLGYLKGCPRLYQYVMIEGWHQKGEGIHLRFGIEYHTALQQYDILRANEVDHEDAVREVVRQLLIRTVDFNPSEEDYGSAVKYKNRQTLLRSVIWYLEQYPQERDPAETFILDSGKPAVELSFRFELEFGPEYKTEENEGPGITVVKTEPTGQPYLLSGHLDRVVSYQDSLFFMDRKTTKSTPGDFYFSQYQPDNQMTLYTLASQVMLKSPVKGGIIDAAQIMIDASRFKRGFTFRTQDQITEWLRDLRLLLKQNERYAEDDYWPMNDRHCNTYRSEESGSIGCPFREVCQKSERLRPMMLKSKFTQLPPEERWNPLKPR